MSEPSSFNTSSLYIPTSSLLDISYDEPPVWDPNLQNSQQTATLVPDSEFTQPISAPYLLKRVGPDQRKQFILYDTMDEESKTKFIEWWRTTVWGGTAETQRNIRWDAKHISDAWKQFDQVAHHITGEPMVMCRLCGTTILHPHCKQSGTNAMKRHPDSDKCRKRAKTPSAQQTIQQTMQHAAVSVIRYYHLNSY